MIGQTLSHYKIIEHLGGGGMGVVYKAQDLKLDRPVALKFLPPDLTRDPEAKLRFVHESKAASALQHNNICVVYDIDETPDGQMFISMEYLEGETLRKKIERGPLKINEAIDICEQVARGLSKAHEQGIVHRDIKPDNIMVTTDGVSKIVDFGLAKLSGRLGDPFLFCFFQGSRTDPQFLCRGRLTTQILWEMEQKHEEKPQKYWGET